MSPLVSRAPRCAWGVRECALSPLARALSAICGSKGYCTGSEFIRHPAKALIFLAKKPSSLFLDFLPLCTLVRGKIQKIRRLPPPLTHFCSARVGADPEAPTSTPEPTQEDVRRHRGLLKAKRATRSDVSSRTSHGAHRPSRHGSLPDSFVVAAVVVVVVVEQLHRGVVLPDGRSRLSPATQPVPRRITQSLLRQRPHQVVAANHSQAAGRPRQKRRTRGLERQQRLAGGGGGTTPTTREIGRGDAI